jgi:nitrogen regulatory protein PII
MRIIDDTKQIYGRDQDFHFYASNAMEWMTGDDLESIVKKIRKSSKTGRYGELHFWVFYVPSNIKEAEYQINNYVPQVDGIIFLGEYK